MRAVLAARQDVLRAAYQAHPDRFVRGEPRPAELPAAVWINPPAATPTNLPPMFDTSTELTVQGQPPVGPVSSGESAQRPLHTGARVARLALAGSEVRQTDVMHPQFQPNLSHAA